MQITAITLAMILLGSITQPVNAQRVQVNCTCEVQVCPGGRDCYVKMVPCACRQ